MKKLFLVSIVILLAPSLLHTYPSVSVFPTGTTVFHPDKTWSGYTVFDTPGEGGTAVIDMNGNLLKRWTEVAGVPGPFRVLPGGYVLGGTNRRRPHQEVPELIQVDWDGEIVWKFDHTELVEEEGKEARWMARQHHDWQREGSPVGYYSPEAVPLVDRGRTLILAHRNVLKPEITDKLLEDEYIVEVTWDGEIVWDWLASDHLDDFGFSGEARNAIYRHPNWNKNRGSADWLHINAMSYVGPNRWFDEGDERFHPDHIMWSSRETNIIGIIDRKGAIVWKMGPDYRDIPALAELGQIVGQGMIAAHALQHRPDQPLMAPDELPEGR
ncbi:MAG: aryl-sulfate sulfotransferase, partial [Candidatus Latescibacteria bacterium]|nr:aryl-sulfate sulfotransferase [Candidatus Latescibacterota bacterium]